MVDVYNHGVLYVTGKQFEVSDVGTWQKNTTK